MEQLTIWEFLEEPAICDIDSMTTPELARVVGRAVGITFTPSGWEDEHFWKYKNLTLTIHKSFYSVDTKTRKEGDAFISVGWSTVTAGCGSPVDSIDEAIEFFKRTMERFEIKG